MEKRTEPFVSIVTPLYNTETYISECIESVLSQSYQNWEYLIVNNCSTDRSREISEKYAKKDSRIRIHNNGSFLPMMQNLNQSMRLISDKSKYCKPLHADDWLFTECISKMVEVAEKYPSVGIVGAYRLDENRVNLDGLPPKVNFFCGREICRGQLLGRPYLFGSPTSLLIRSDLVRDRDPFYDESSLQADKEVCFEILKTHDFGFVHQVLTFTRRHNDSVTAQEKQANTERRIPTLIKFGPIFLNKTEFDQALNLSFKNYYSRLAKALFELRGKDFFKYQNEVLRRRGAEISWSKLAKATFLQMLDMRGTARVLKGGIVGRRIKREGALNQCRITSDERK